MIDKELTKATARSSSQSSTDSSRNYDYTGQDIAHKYGDEAATLDAQRSTALMGEPLSAMPISKRIGHLQQYLRAYQTGHNPNGIPVTPGVRIASERHSQSQGGDNSSGVEYGWPNPAPMPSLAEGKNR
jgi:hypothetical protein